MDADFQAYVDGIAPEFRALFDRLHGIVMATTPEAELGLAYDMPTYRVGKRRLNLGVWKHGVSVYGWRRDNDGGFLDRHPDLLSSKTDAANPAEGRRRDLGRRIRRPPRRGTRAAEFGAACGRRAGSGGKARPTPGKRCRERGRRRKERWRGAGLVALDEDALAGALLGGLDDGVFEVLGDRRHAG